jgi:hypothetical protein
LNVPLTCVPDAQDITAMGVLILALMTQPSPRRFHPTVAS